MEGTEEVVAKVSVQLDPAVYWKLRARVLETQATRKAFETQMREQETAMLVEAGLEPKRNYNLTDATTTATEA